MQYVITQTATLVTLDNGETLRVTPDHPNYVRVVNALVSGADVDIRDMLTISKTLEQWSEGRYTERDGKVLLDGEELQQVLADRVLQAVRENQDPNFLLRFSEHLKRNPSWRSVQSLYGFLQHNDIAIDPEGMIIAYKGVRKDFMDVHSGTILNKPGEVIEYPRNKVSDDPDTPCHEGLHAGSLNYASSFTPDNVVVIVRINPEDVVCVPRDCNAQKLRCCRYEVVGLHVGVPMDRHVDLSDNLNPPDDEDDDGEDEDHDNCSYCDDCDDCDEDCDDCDEDDTPVSVKRPLSRMSALELMDVDLGTLRTYAAKELRIVGASKIPGGKAVLIQRIAEARKVLANMKP